MEFDWSGKKYIKPVSEGEGIAKALSAHEKLEKASNLYNQMRPYLLEALKVRCASMAPIKVKTAIRTFVDRVQKSETKATFHTGVEIIPSGDTLTYAGHEMGQMFFKSEKTDQEFGIHVGDLVNMGDGNVVRNTGFIGLLTNTDIFDEVKSNLIGNEEE